jgi:uncharacterized membrane protein
MAMNKTRYKLLQYFLQGLLVLGPVAITLYFVYSIFDKVDNILRPYINIPGIGFIIIIAVIISVGYLSSFFLLGRIISLINQLLSRLPGVRYFYSFIKDFFEAFAGNKKKFNNAVLACVDDSDVWRVGFITQEDMSRFGMPGFVAVYLPMAYSVAGNVYLVPQSRIRPITTVTSAQAMKFAVSGGVTDVVEEVVIEVKS